MLKNIFIGALVTILVVAVSIGAYDAVRTQLWGQPQTATTTAAANLARGQGNGNGQGGWRGQNGATGQSGLLNGTPQPQAAVAEWITVAGTVQQVEPNGLSVTTADGKTLWIQFGQSRFVSTQNVVFKVSDQVSIKGFYENSQYQAGTVTNTTTQQVLKLRDETGRPLWAGNGG